MKTILWMLFLIALPALAEIPESVKQALHVAEIPEENVGIFVQPINKSTPVLIHQADIPMNPASVMKLLTSYAALDLLGAAYKWKTDALIAGNIHNGILYGNLYLKGYGDPALTVDQLWLFINRIHSTGVRQINGDIVFDSSYFAITDKDLSSFDNKPERAYNAVPDALLVNFNAVEINISADINNNKVLLNTEPQIKNLKIINRLKLDKNDCSNWRDHLTTQVTTHKVKTLTIEGKYSILCGEKNYPLTLYNNYEYLTGLFLQLWQETGGRIKGKTKMGITPEDATLLVQFDSSSLTDNIRNMNKWSNNVMARQIYLTFGATHLGAPATTTKSWEVINQWLIEKGWAFPELHIENGAGLSRVDRITPRHMGMLLIDAWKHPLMPEFVSSLPITGVDGTMRSRFKEEPIMNRGHLKSGTLNDVKTIAGYVLNQTDDPISVVFFINHPNAYKGKNAEEELIKWAIKIPTH